MACVTAKRHDSRASCEMMVNFMIIFYAEDEKTSASLASRRRIREGGRGKERDRKEGIRRQDQAK
jgi:hypothetical protein